MSDVITKKRRGIKYRIKKRVLLVVTDKDLSEDDVYRDFRLNPEEIAVRIIKSNLSGEILGSAVKRYMHEHQIITAQGDRVLYLIKNRKGGDVNDWQDD